MAVTFVGVTTGSAEFTTVTLSCHANTQVGDLLVAICFRDEGYATNAWTGNPFTRLGGLDAGTNATTGGRIEVWTLTATAAGATSYSYTESSGASTGTVHLFTLRGAGTPTMATQNNTSSSTSSVAPSVGSGTLDMLLCAWDARSQGSARTWTVPGTMTSAGQINPSGTYIVTCAAYKDAIAAGTKTATVSTTSTSLAVSVQIPSGSSTVNKSGSDSGTGTETGTVAAAVNGTDSGAGSETGSVAWLQTGSDSGTGSESGFISQLQTGTDTGTGAESGTIAATTSGGDTGTGSSAGTIAANTTGSDSGAGSEAGFIKIPGTDAGAGADSLVSLHATVTNGDTAVGAEGGYVDTLFGDLVIALWAVDPDTGALLALPDCTQLTMSRERNGAGSISLNYPVDGLNFSRLRDTITSDRDLEVEIWTIGSPTGALRGYLQEASGDDVAEDRSWQFAGGFCELRMSEAVVWNQEVITTTTVTTTVKITDDDYEVTKVITVSSPSGGSHTTTTVTHETTGSEGANTETDKTKGDLVFSGATPGELVNFILDQAQDRGALTDITRGFTDAEDSNGTPWPQIISTTFSPGSGYDQILARLIDFGLSEWAITWTGTEKRLDLWIPQGRGVDRTTGNRPIVLRKARNLLDAPRKWSLRDSGTVVLAAGADGVYEDASDLDAETRRGRRIEVSASANNLEDSAAVEAFAQKQLETVTPGLLEVTHGIGFLPGEPRPLIAFDIGDWVYSQTSADLERLRVVQWTLSVDNSQSPSGTVTLNDTVTDALSRLQARLTALVSGDTVVGTSTASQSPDTGIPQAPGGVLAGSTAYLVEGIAHALVTVSWDAVLLNTDGTAASDLAGYKIQYSYTATGEWVGVEDVGPNRNDATFDASPGVEVSVRVAAYDQNGNVSDWSSVVTIITENDTTPPGVPSTPIVSDYLGTLRIRWNGNTSTGADMMAAYPDFELVEVHVSTGSLFTPSASTRVGQLYGVGEWVVTDLPYGTAQFVRLVAVDRSGNASSPSTQASATPAQVVGSDVFDGAIGTTKLADAAITTAKINDLAVNNAKIGSVEMGKVTAGQITAAMIFTTGGLIASRAAGTGLGWEGDSAGIRFYNASSTKTIEFKASDGSALITGTYQSGLSGERINILPDGTFRIYPSSGTDYAQIANDAGVIRFRSIADGSGRRGYVDMNPNGLTVRYASTSNTYTQFDAGLTYGVINAPVCGIRIWRQYTPADSTKNRMHFLTASASGDDGNSVIHYYGRGMGAGSEAGSINDKMGIMRGAARAAGVMWDSGQISIVGPADDEYGNFVATGISSPSSALAKTRPQPLPMALEVTARDIVAAAPSRAWYYLDELKPRGTKPGTHLQRIAEDGTAVMVEQDWLAPERPAKLRFGPIAEDLEAVSPHLVTRDPRGLLLTDVNDKIGVVWAAVAEVDTDHTRQLDELRHRLDVLEQGSVIDGEVIE